MNSLHMLSLRHPLAIFISVRSPLAWNPAKLIILGRGKLKLRHVQTRLKRIR